MKELQIQTFLRAGKTLTDLYQRYEIQGTLSKNGDKVVFNYRVLSPLDAPIVQESRALVLDTKNWDVVSKSPNAFFAIEEPYAEPVIKAFDWDSAKAMTKLDGALVTLYHYNGEWCVCTRYCTDGELRVYTINASPSSLTWRELVEMCVKDMGYSWKEFTQKLNKDVFYTFEVTSPENRVVVVYTERRLTLVAAVSRETLEEIDIYALDYPKLKVDYVTVRTLDEANTLLLKNDDPLSYEGYILLDKHFNRLKLRNPKFLQMLQFYSPQDELTALREIRMMDANSGYNTGTGGTSTGTGGTSTSSAEIFSTQSLLNRMMGLSKYVSDSYQEIQNDPTIASEHYINKIWPEALEYLKQGMNMSDMLDKMSEEEILEALQKFETIKQGEEQTTQ